MVARVSILTILTILNEATKTIHHHAHFLYFVLQDWARARDMDTRSSLPRPGDDPFVSIMFAIPRLLVRRSSCDESLQLRSVAYLASATAYCCNRTKAGVPGWFATVAGEDTKGFGDSLHMDPLGSCHILLKCSQCSSTSGMLPFFVVYDNRQRCSQFTDRRALMR